MTLPHTCAHQSSEVLSAAAGPSTQLSCCSVNIPTVQQCCQASPTPLFSISHGFHDSHLLGGVRRATGSSPTSNAHHEELQHHCQLQATHPVLKELPEAKQHPLACYKHTGAQGRSSNPSIPCLAASSLQSPLPLAVPRAEASNPGMAVLRG